MLSECFHLYCCWFNYNLRFVISINKKFIRYVCIHLCDSYFLLLLSFRMMAMVSFSVLLPMLREYTINEWFMENVCPFSVHIPKSWRWHTYKCRPNNRMTINKNLFYTKKWLWITNERDCIICDCLVTVTLPLPPPTTTATKKEKSYDWNVQCQGFIFIVREVWTVAMRGK